MPFISGLPETGCGIGSTLARTERIRVALPGLFAEFGIKSVLDAPCGDLNWMSRVDLSGVDYIGCDYDPEHLEAARKRDARARFVQIDILTDELPATDLMLCREFMQHISNDEIKTVLGKLRCKWLLATNYNNQENDELIRGFRKVNLSKPPFNLPKPVREIQDGSDHVLALWRM